MNPSVLIPTPDIIPVSAAWFKFFLILTFMLHILLINIILGSVIISFFNYFKSDNKNNLLEKDISKKLTFVIAFAINLGVAPLLFLQVLYGHFIYVSSQLMAVYWLSVIGLLIIAYYSAYYYKFNFDVLNSNRIYFLGIMLAVFLFIGFIFTNNMTLMLNPKTWLDYFNMPDGNFLNGTFLNLSEPSLIPRFLHFILASVAIAGLFIAITWTLKKDAANAEENIDKGMKWFSYATMLQIIVGFWFHMSLPKNIMALFMGGNKLYTAVYISSLLMVILTLFFSIKRKVRLTTGFTFILIFLMIIIRDMVRTAYLKPFFQISDLKVMPQYLPFILFLLSLIIGIGLVIYMLKLAVKSEKVSDNI